jgi:hypothetical protein
VILVPSKVGTTVYILPLLAMPDKTRNVLILIALDQNDVAYVTFPILE